MQKIHNNKNNKQNYEVWKFQVPWNSRRPSRVNAIKHTAGTRITGRAKHNKIRDLNLN